MKVNATGGNATKKTAPQGAHIGRCYQIIDLGTTEDKKFGGRKRKIQFLFELPNELEVFDESKGAQPYYVRTSMTLSMSEKANLRKFIESWIGKTMTDREASNFEIMDLLSLPAMLNISHRVTDAGTFANIMSISPLPKGITCPAQINPSLSYDTTAHNQDAFSQLPEFVRTQIMESDEYRARLVGAPKYEPSVVLPQAQPVQSRSQVDPNLTKDLDDIFGSSFTTSTSSSPF
jgi:hypothetical protein